MAYLLMHAKLRVVALLSIVALGAVLLPASAQAQVTARFGHSATLLPDGNILVVGGASDDTPTLLSGAGTVQIVNENNGDVTNASIAGFTSITSHTATLMPNGEVLVAGGKTNATTAHPFVQIYNPRADCWRTPVAATARFNHTATLLPNGNVLLCGGQGSTPFLSLASCSVFQPTAHTTAFAASCASAGGAFGAGVTMQAPRALHTATLLGDGRVWLAGGYDNTGFSQNQYLATTEVYTAGGTVTGASASLITARADHRASLLGNGKVLVSGGYNGFNQIENRGILDSTELYDAIGNSVSPGGKLPARVLDHGQVVNGDGSVTLFGGLGNITTNYFDPSTVLTSTWSFLQGCFGGVGEGGMCLDPSMTPLGQTLPLMKISTGAIELPLTITVAPQATGVIQDGFVLFSRPTLTFSGGSAALRNGAESASGQLSGTWASLNGQMLTCATGSSSCGVISDKRMVVNVDAAQLGVSVGTYTITPMSIGTGITSVVSDLVSTSTIDWTPHGLNASGPQNGQVCPRSTLQGDVTVTGLSRAFIGARISTATFNLTAASMAINDPVSGDVAMSVSLSSALARFTNLPQFVTTAIDGTGQFTARLLLHRLAGNVTAVTPTPVDPFTGNTCTTNNGMSNTGRSVSGIAGTLNFAVDRINLNQGTEFFSVDVATVVIRKMVMADSVRYTPTANTWAYATHSTSGLSQRYGITSTLTPTNTMRNIGGRTCDPPNETYVNRCTLTAGGSAASIIETTPAWARTAANMGSPRINATSTLLPNGKILIAGGSNGPNVLASAEIYDPVTQLYTPTGRMNQARDLHTATLLPNGRVLVAGGFSTTATSTGTTDTAEIYYPDTGVWIYTKPMPFSADNHTATLLPNGKVLVAGGFSNGSYLTAAAIFEPAFHRWTSQTAMPAARAGHTATLLQDGRVLIVGGLNATGTLCSGLIYDSSFSGGGFPWYATPNMEGPGFLCSNTAVHGHSATQLRNGTVLVAGGNNPLSGEVNSAFIYRPAPVPAVNNVATPGAWTHLGAAGGKQVNRKRFKHAAVAAPNGKVFLIGGAQALGNALSDVETYDPGSSTFTIVGALSEARFGFPATVSADGFITAFGGSNGVSPVNTAERSYFAGEVDAVSLGVAAGARKPILSSVNVSPFRGFNSANTVFDSNLSPNGPSLTLLGTNLRGVGESAGGSMGSSSHHNPRLLLQGMSGSGTQSGGTFTLDLSTRIYFSDSAVTTANNWTNVGSSITVELPNWNGTPANPGLGGLMVPYGWYQLRAYSNAVYSDSLLVQAGPPKPPSAPGAIVALPVNITKNSILWTWSAGSTPASQMDGFNLYSSTSGIYSTMTVTAQTQWLEGNLAPNATGALMIAAFNASGDGPLTYSATYYTLCSTPSFKTLPSVTTFTGVGFSSLRLNWDANANSPGTIYEVYQSTDWTNGVAGTAACAATLTDPPCHGDCPLGCPFSVNVTTPVPILVNLTSTSTVIDSLLPNTTYSFHVRAFNGSGIASDYSATVTTRTLSPVSNLAGVASSPTSIQWNWLDPGNVLYFKVYNATVPFGAPGSVLAQPAVATFNDTGLSVNTRRVVMVSAVTVAGEGPLSPSATVFTLAAVPGVVLPAIPSVTTGSYTANWTANGNPLGTSYRLVTLDALGVGLSTVTTTAFSSGFGGFAGAGASFSARVDAINGDGISSGFLSLGNSATAAVEPQGLSIVSKTPGSITFTWGTANNSAEVVYELTYSSKETFGAPYVSAIVTPLPFSAAFGGSTITVSGLLTSSTYSFRVQGRNPLGVVTAFSNTVADASPDNGGVAQGSLGVLVNHTSPTTLAGSIGAGRSILFNIPANAFPQDTFLTLGQFSAAGVNNKCPGGVDIGISIVTTPSIQPVAPVFLTIGYTTELNGIPTSQAALNRVDASGTCVPLATTVNTTAKTLTAQLNHFSLFQVANVPPSGDVNQTVVFPNPFLPSSGNGFVTFKNMPAGARVRIFSMRGQLAWEGESNGSGLVTWNGVNRFGRGVGSGVYLAVIESGGQKNIVKVAVLR